MKAKKKPSLQPFISKQYQKKIDYWKQCDVNKLVDHFHCYNSDANLFNRLDVLHLGDKKINRLFQENLAITSFDILFGLDSKASPVKKFTFRPIITVYYQKGKPRTEVFDYGEPMMLKQYDADSPVSPFIIPPPFKDWLVKNWAELDVSLVDDIFAASEKPKAENSSLKEKNPKKLVPPKRNSWRVLGYHFTDTINETFLQFINDHKGSIQQFYLHLGMDMNKFSHKEEFSFSPVFEVRIPKPSDEHLIKIHRYGLRSIPVNVPTGKNVVSEEEHVYYEYVMPCPSTCP